MTRSYRTDPPRVDAERRIKRDEDGTPILARIIERKPLEGDVHPLPKKVIRRFMDNIPLEFMYGLNQIELRARKAGQFGIFGCYSPKEKRIILYSLPLLWVFNKDSKEPLDTFRTLARYNAEILENDEVTVVKWPDHRALATWCFMEVFCHELGHHYDRQYDTRRKRTQDVSFIESYANLQSIRIVKAWFETQREQKK